MLQMNFLLGGSAAQQLPCMSPGAEVDTFDRAPAPTELSDVVRGWFLHWLWRLLAIGPKLAISCEIRMKLRGFPDGPVAKTTKTQQSQIYNYFFK